MTSENAGIRPQAAAQDTDELARVQVAAEDADDTVRWYVRLRPWLIALAVLLLVECGARWYFDYGVDWRRQRFDNYPSRATLDETIRAVARDPAYRIVILGDSTVPGSAMCKRDETIPRQLEEAVQRRLPDRVVHVWDFGMAGCRATDELCLLLRVQDAKPDLVVVSGNRFISAADIQQLPLFHPWVARSLRSIPPSIAPFLPARPLKEEFEDGITNFVEGHVRAVGMRQTINASLFGVQTRNAPFESPNPIVMAGISLGKKVGRLKPEPWFRRGMMLSSVPSLATPVDERNLSGRYYREIVEALRSSGTPGVTYLTPENPLYAEVSAPRDARFRWRSVLSGFMSGPGIDHADLSDLVPTSEFIDMTHLLPEGNRRVAEALADRIAPIVRGKGQVREARTP